ncbi:transporter [Thiococcus pfennigii]|nr:transporter [Thiococcus pfennigii]
MPSVWMNSSPPSPLVRHRPPPRLGRPVAAMLLLAAALAGAGLLAGCAPAIIGGTAVGVSVFHDRRPTEIMLADQRIELAALERYNQNAEIADYSRISATSYNRVLLLTGQAETEEIRRRYAELASRIPEVRKVVDQVTIGPVASLARQGEDAYLTSRVKVALASVRIAGFDPTRVKVVTAAGTVHLMGLLTPQEAQAVIAKVRYVPGVVQIVNLFETYPRPET